jgi:predicted ArsR family transcriptional regulator
MGWHRETFENQAKDEARRRAVDEAKRDALAAWKAAEANNERLDSQLKEIVELRRDNRLMGEQIRALQDRMDAMSKWAKSLDIKKKKPDLTDESNPVE